MANHVQISFGGFVPMLTIAFIVLKLCGKIDWSWVWVLSPMWITLGVGLICALICMVLNMHDSKH